jgi:hypothetical protein
LAEQTTALPDTLPRPRIDPQRMAWGVLLISFAVFCMICVISGVGVNYFLFSSSVPMETTVQVAKGTVVVTGRAVVQQFELTNNDELRTDAQTQATIFFRDSQNNGRLIASVTMRGNTSFTLWRALRPRFNWGNDSYNIDLQNVLGNVDVFVPKGLERDLRLTIRSPQGVLVDLGESGQYSVSVSDTQTRVVNREGQVSLVPANSNEGRAIPMDTQGLIANENPAEVILTATLANLLQNSNFQDIFPSPEDSNIGIAEAWGCTNSTANLPRGRYQAEMQDGRSLLRLLRSDSAEIITNGETRCGSYFPGAGLDVTGMSTLVLRATFNIQYQSLNACGQTGSECPLMLRVDYRDENGLGQRWFHGFYATLNPQLNYPLSCDSCASEHEQVNEKVWYTYDSGNWFNLFPPGKRPVAISNVQFYASGHQYDVYVGEVALLGGL